MNCFKRRHVEGFTLIEILITVAIVAILASIALPLSELATRRSQERELQHALRQIRDALDAHRRAAEEGRVMRSPEHSGYPPALNTLVEGVPDAKSANNAKIYFLRRLPRDPFDPNPDSSAEATWGKRGYDSPPDDPRPGKDVFDVYSLSRGTGLNGIPYRRW